MAPLERRGANRQQEEALPPHKYHDNHVQLVNRLREDPENEFYASNNIPDLTDLVAFRRQHDTIKTGEQERGTIYSIRGRITRIRSAGECLRFYDVQIGEEKIQVVCQVTEGNDIEAYKRQHEHLARGDIIGITGHPGRTSPWVVRLVNCLSTLMKWFF
jgi:lysyl-tRNA synthetase class 2